MTDQVSISETTCATWCNDGRPHPGDGCWGRVAAVPLALHGAFGPTSSTLSAAPYRTHTGTDVVRMNLVRLDADGHDGVDTDVDITADEARSIARLLLEQAEQIESET